MLSIRCANDIDKVTALATLASTIDVYLPAWAGRRLPTERESKLEAVGGNEERLRRGGFFMLNRWTGPFPNHNDGSDGFAGTLLPMLDRKFLPIPTGWAHLTRSCLLAHAYGSRLCQSGISMVTFPLTAQRPLNSVTA